MSDAALKRSTASIEAAERWCASKSELLDAEGLPCPFAVDAALKLKSRRGGAITRAMVVEARLKLMGGEK